MLLLGNRQLLLLDRTKWAQNRLLRFDFEEILSRRETDTLKATAVLLHKDSLLRAVGHLILTRWMTIRTNMRLVFRKI